MNFPSADLTHIAEHASEDLKRIGNERILVTGASGFFGRWVCAALKSNANVVSLARNIPAGVDASRWLIGDVREPLGQEHRFDSIIHMATPASLSLSRENPNEMLDVIIEGARGIVKTVRNTGAKRLLFTSSGAVSKQASGYDAYAEGKRRAEELFLNELPKLGCEVKIARCYAFSGPGLPLDSHFALGNFVRQALAGETIVIKGDGKALRSYLYAADLSVWLIGLLSRGKPESVYDVGSDQSVSIADLAREVAGIAGRVTGKKQVEVRVLGDRSVPSVDYLPDISRARDELERDVWISRNDGIERMIQWQSSIKN